MRPRSATAPGGGFAARSAPRGAIAVAGTAVILLMICWLAIYLFVFLPRGTVG